MTTEFLPRWYIFFKSYMWFSSGRESTNFSPSGSVPGDTLTRTQFQVWLFKKKKKKEKLQLQLLFIEIKLVCYIPWIMTRFGPKTECDFSVLKNDCVIESAKY